MYWRYQLKQFLPSSRKVIFWRNDADNLTTSPDDIVQYWGSQSQTANGTLFIIFYSHWQKLVFVDPFPLRLLVFEQRYDLDLDE